MADRVAATEHSYSRYSAGCRCEACRAAKAAYQRTKRAEAAAARNAAQAAGITYVAPGITHGTAGYRDSGCRCPDCRRARRIEQLRYRRGEPAVRRWCENLARETAWEAASLGHPAGFEALYAVALREELALVGGVR